MKHRCMVMTLRLSSSRRSGSRQIHRSWKKCIKFTAISSPCWSFFSTSKALSTRNSYPWLNRQWQVLLWGFEAAEGGHSAQTSRQVEEKFLHHDNIPTHTSLVWQFLTSKNITVIPTHHSPDLAPCDFFLFPKMKLQLKGRCFDMTEEIHTETQEVIDTLTFENFQRCMNHGKHAGIAVYMPKGTTLKEMVVTRSYSKKLLRSNSPNFWEAPCIYV